MAAEKQRVPNRDSSMESKNQKLGAIYLCKNIQTAPYDWQTIKLHETTSSAKYSYAGF